MLVFAVLGGLALFIFGMNIMTDGLRKAAGARLQSFLSKTTRNRFSGLGLGTALGTLVHSSATTVMLVGFVNAGLMTLENTVPPMLGANIGTSISMQAISFKLGDYCYFAITLGFILNMAAPNPKTKQLGKALLGFGLLFLGMDTMSAAIKPHREALAPILAGIDGSTTRGLLIGIGTAAGLTAIWQSSGATIAIIFALVSAGVFTRFEQVYPIVLGAHIGTCATALLGSIGTNIEARRSAFSHLFFNLFNVTMAVAARPFFFWLVPLTSDDLIRQTANLHSVVMVAATALVLPVAGFHAKLVRFIVHSRKPLPEPSFLDDELLEYPERAIVAVIKELRRVTKVAAESLAMNAKVLLFTHTRRTVQQIRLNEKIINEIKLAVKDYLASMTARYLSRRQTLLIQHLDRCITDIERIGDHIEEVCNLSLKRQRMPKTMVDMSSWESLFRLYEEAKHVLDVVIESLDPGYPNFQRTAQAILDARDRYVDRSLTTKAGFTDKIVQKNVTPIAAMYFMEYITAFDRIVRHAKTIALAEKHPDFWIKRRKLERRATEAPEVEAPTLADPNDFLDKLQNEDYL